MASLLDQTGKYEAYRRQYGGSDNTAPSFNRPQYSKYNSLSKSRDFGSVDNFGATINGVVGGHTGRSTLYFKIRTLGVARLGVTSNPLGSIDDRLISVSILDDEHNPIALGPGGFAERAPLDSETTFKTNDRLPPGTYFFTVSTNQWREIPFSITAVVQRYLECRGSVKLEALPRLRLALVKLIGAITGTDQSGGTILAPAKLKSLAGAAQGDMVPSLSLAIMAGAAVLRMEPYGRLQQNYRIQGVALGTNQNIATMTARKPYGYGY